MTPERAFQDVDKKHALEECISTIHAEATLLAEKMRPAEEIQATVRSIARAYLEGTKLFTEQEISLVVSSMKIGVRG